MKKQLTYTADRGKTLTLQELAQYVIDAERINFRVEATRPIVTVEPGGTKGRPAAGKGGVKIITAEKEVW